MAEPSSNGSVNYSVKELIEQVSRKIDRIDAKLDQKAERAVVHDLSSRLAALELLAVKKEGPIIDEMRMYERRVQALENDVNTKILDAIQTYNNAQQTAKDRTWRTRDKIFVSVMSLIGALGTAVSCVVLVTH